MLFEYVFLDLDTALSFQRGVNAEKQTKRLGEVVKASVTAVKNEHFSSFKQIIGLGSIEPFLTDYGTRLVDRLFEGGKSIDEVVWTIIPTAAAAAATQGQGVCVPYVTLKTPRLLRTKQWAQLIDLYLSDEYFPHWPAIQKLANSDAPEDFEKLKKYALEGLALVSPLMPGLY